MMCTHYECETMVWCRIEYMGDQFVYVSGRKRAAGEMNGKSSNLNNCLSQIYPPGIPIPPNELVCIFDADQVLTTCSLQSSHGCVPAYIAPSLV